MTDKPETFAGEDEKSSAGILSALRKAEDAFRDWQTTCSMIDQIYGGMGDGDVSYLLENNGWSDTKLDLFWSSFEVMKPAVYAQPPKPVVAPMFKDGRRLPDVAAEMLERCAISTLTRTGIDNIMTSVRDDLIFNSRGVIWLTYEADDDGKRVCWEFVDRKDFLHEPVRTWAENGWVAKRSWLTEKEAEKRFAKHGDAWKDATYLAAKDRDGDRTDEDRATAKKAGVWEVWHRADNKVYWVAEGVDTLLDSGAPHLDLSDFFPCPKPAYATRRRRSLIPIPDWTRYAIHFKKISDLTGRIYLLLDQVRMKGLIPAGGDVGDAIEELMRSDDDQLLIPVPGAALMAGADKFVSWMPLNDIAEAIQGLLQARSQLIEDYYQLSGVSDIMRGATDEDETLGAQQLKTQFGSVRVREKSQELQRLAADGVKITAEIIAQKFDTKTLLDMSQMEVPTKADIAKRVKAIEQAAQSELKGLAEKAKEAAEQHQQAPQQPGQQQTPQIDPQQAQAQFQQAQQQILAKHADALHDAEQQVPIEDVLKLLRDDRTRAFTFEIESSSTILTDEMEEKRSRNEFMEAFTNSTQALMGLAGMGEPGAKLSGALMKFVLAPYRAGRELDGAIDAFIDAAPDMAKAAQAAQGKDGENADLAQAQQGLAEAEKVKAQAAMAAVEAKSAQAQADNQRKMMELQQNAQDNASRSQESMAKLQLQLQKQTDEARQKEDLLQSQIDLNTANTAKILASIGLDERKQQLGEYTAATDMQNRQVDQQLEAQRTASDMQASRHGQMHTDRQHELAENSAEKQDVRADRQQDLAERTAQQESK